MVDVLRHVRTTYLFLIKENHGHRFVSPLSPPCLVHLHRRKILRLNSFITSPDFRIYGNLVTKPSPSFSVFSLTFVCVEEPPTIVDNKTEKARLIARSLLSDRQGRRRC
ncbi:hypothetical protein N665_0547s0015 [Sinapis alba]|nr:hypothetical protein N665_0547s0015 [Sinapis alba]